MRRKILLLSDLQSGAEEIEIVDAVSFDIVVAESHRWRNECDRLNDRLMKAHDATVPGSGKLFAALNADVLYLEQKLTDICAESQKDDASASTCGVIADQALRRVK